MTVRDIAKALDVHPSEVSVERIPLDEGLYVNEHSWAGLMVHEGYLIRDGRATRLDFGGWYSSNGKITRDHPPVPLAVALRRAGAREGDIVALVDWSNYSGHERQRQCRVFRLTAEDAATIAAAADPLEQTV